MEGVVSVVIHFTGPDFGNFIEAIILFPLGVLLGLYLNRK